jgi:hypothetical protein
MGPEPPFLTEPQKPQSKSLMPPPRQSRSCVIVVENLPVPFDRRVWQEAQALARAGWLVSVICPANAAYPKRFEVIDDVAIYGMRCRPRGEERSPTSANTRRRSFTNFGS